MKKFIYLITFLFIINISIISNQAFAEENNQSDKPVSESNLNEGNISNVDIAKYENEDLLTNLGTDNSSNEDVKHIKSEESTINSDSTIEESEKLNANDTVNNENNKNNSEKQITQSENNTNEKANIESENDVESTDKNVRREDKQASKVIDDDSEDPVGLNKDEDIIGTDDRKIVVDINKNPYKSIVFIKSYFNDRNYIGGTGFMIDDYSVLTAAHVVTSEDKSIDIKKILVYAGYQNEVAKFGTARVIKTYVTPEWSQSHNRKYDMALLLLDKPLGKRIGKLNIIDKANHNEAISTSGYPGIESKNIRIGNQYYSSGKLLKETDYRLYYDSDTEGGQSGSPVFNSNNDVIAIHTRGFTNRDVYKLNSGVRLTSKNIGIIQNWKDEMKLEEFHKLIYLSEENVKIWSDLNLNHFIINNSKVNGRYFRTDSIYTDSLGRKYSLVIDKNNNFVGFVSIDNYIPITSIISYKEVQLNSKDVKLYANLYGDLKKGYELPYNGYYKVREIYNLPNNEVMYKLYDRNNKWLGYINNYNVHEIEFRPYNEILQIEKSNFTVMQDIFTEKDIKSKNMYHKLYYAKYIFIDNNNNKIVKLYNSDNQFVGIIGIEAAKKIEIEHVNKRVKLISYNYDFYDELLEKFLHLTTRYHNKILKAKCKMILVDGTIAYSLYDDKDKWIGFISSKGVKIL